jgi:hypothetical protein
MRSSALRCSDERGSLGGLFALIGLAVGAPLLHRQWKRIEAGGNATGSDDAEAQPEES